MQTSDHVLIVLSTQTPLAMLSRSHLQHLPLQPGESDDGIERLISIKHSFDS